LRKIASYYNNADKKKDFFMEQRTRTKLCPHCDGDVELDIVVCPYCGKDVNEQKLNPSIQKPVTAAGSLSPEETLSSLYPPPYKIKTYDQELHKEEEEEEVIPEQAKPLQEDKISLTPVVLFSIGLNLLFFGLFVFLFSSKGELFLKLNSNWWVAYVLFGCPLIYFGYRKLN
jgi:hypothetical protein